MSKNSNYSKELIVYLKEKPRVQGNFAGQLVNHINALITDNFPLCFDSCDRGAVIILQSINSKINIPP